MTVAGSDEMPGTAILPSLFRDQRQTVLLRAALSIVVIALLNWISAHDIPLGFLYLLPMLMVGRVLSPPWIAAVAGLCTFLAEAFDIYAWNVRTGIPRDILYFAAFFLVGLFVWEFDRNRRAVETHLHEVEKQRDARQEAEVQLRVLIESSPAAIITADSSGIVLMANEAAHRLLGLNSGELAGRFIHTYFPSLANVWRREVGQSPLRAVMEARGRRADGEAFLAEISFSTYATSAGTRLTAMILDSSEELRSREEASLQQMLAGSRLAVAAASHEIRNISGAIAVVHQNLSRNSLLSGNKDFDTLGNLVTVLERIADLELRQGASHATEVDLAALLDDLRIVVSPSLRDEAIGEFWSIAPDLPPVWADRAMLMQVFVNLATNSMRALSQHDAPRLTIAAHPSRDHVLVEFTDNGGGVDRPEQLFHPFQSGAQATGLGLYLSRAFMRSFGGELRYRAVPGGACFEVEIPIADHQEIES
jgi:two-component system sensor kinase FixL